VKQSIKDQEETQESTSKLYVNTFDSIVIQYDNSSQSFFGTNLIDNHKNNNSIYSIYDNNNSNDAKNNNKKSNDDDGKYL